MPISSHCFWPWLSLPAGFAASAVRLRKSSSRSISPSQTRLEMVLQRDLEVLRDAQSLEDAWHLDFDADAPPDALVRLAAA